MKSRYRSIHFDMDGVIADTEPLHVAAEQQTCRNYELAINPDEWGGFKGRTAQAIFTHLLHRYGDPATHTVDELIEHKTDLFLQSAEMHLRPIDGVLEFLDWARDAHETMTLVTSSNRRVQECIIGKFGVAHLFDAIVTGDDITHGKPHPEPYETALLLTNSQPEAAVVIEDSKSGVISALGARCAALAVTTSHSAEELAPANPTYITRSYVQARGVLSA